MIDFPSIILHFIKFHFLYKTIMTTDHSLQKTYLLTPGPLTTHPRVKQAMQKDWGSWDSDFQEITLEVRKELLTICNGHSDYTCVPMQGSGTFAVESALGSLIPKTGKVLVLMNGAYGLRTKKILEYLGREIIALDKGDYLPPMPDEVDELLTKNPDVSHVFLVYCETSSGILNPLEEIANVVHQHQKKLIVDSMSTFGALPIDLKKTPVSTLIASANKCIEGVPGFGFVITQISEIETSQGNAHSLSLDLYDQWAYMEKTNQWRYTPPTHIVVAFLEALKIYKEEGGCQGRLNRYQKHSKILIDGMRKIGFQTLLEDQWLSPIITTFLCPQDTHFEFTKFYDLLKKKGFVIYPGKLTVIDSFRMGNIGAFDHQVMSQLITTIQEVVDQLGITDFTPSQREDMVIKRSALK